MYIHHRTRVSAAMVYIHTSAWGSASCSFYSNGQYQSLYAWNEQQVRPHAFLFIHSNANERGPTAVSFNEMCKHAKHSKSLLNRILSFMILLCFTASCCAPRDLVLTCQERHIEIYVDNQYLGRDMVKYTFHKGQKYVEVSCRDNGMEVYHKKIYVEDLKNGNLVELQIPKNLKYSNNRHY